MNPDVSVILPCRNEVAFIDSCLESILDQRLDNRDLEIIVTDGMSQDGTREKLAAWEQRDPRIRVVDNPGNIVPTGLNAAIEVARAPVIVRLDAHSTYPVDYLAKCLNTLERSGADNVGGIVITLPRGDHIGAQVVQAVSTHRFGMGGARFRTGASEGPADTVPFGCFRRDLFDRIGPFDERLVRHQDYEFNARIRASGGLIWLDPDITVDYYNQETLWGLLRQAFLSGRWNAFAWFLAPYAFSLRHVVPAAFVLFLVLGGIAALASPTAASGYMIMMTIYVGLALIASVEQAVRFKRPRLAAMLPFAFFAYHTTYGAGIVLGAILLLLGRTPFASNTPPWAGAPSFRIRPTPPPAPVGAVPTAVLLGSSATPEHHEATAAPRLQAVANEMVEPVDTTTA